MRALFVLRSQNAKLGPIPASIIDAVSCWDGCALLGKGCYAFQGPLGMQWRRLKGTVGDAWNAFCDKVAALPRRTLWRYAQAGDLPGVGGEIDPELLSQLLVANRGKTVLAYTHKPVLGDDPVAARNRVTVAVANKSGFTINLSANNPAQADELADLAIGPVVTILPHEYARRASQHRAKNHRPDVWTETISEWRDRISGLPTLTPAGRRIAVCPTTYSAATCLSCGACAKARDAIIGFPAHGPWHVAEKSAGLRSGHEGRPARHALVS